MIQQRRWATPLPDPYEEGHRLGLIGISVTEHTWPTAQDYREFTAGWRAGTKARQADQRKAMQTARRMWREQLQQMRSRRA